jgi:hypothetical protein
MQRESFIDQFSGTVSFKGVYYVECSEEDARSIRHSTVPIAIQPIIDGQNHIAKWRTNSSREDWVVWDHVGANVGEYVHPQAIPSHDPTVVGDCPDEIVVSSQNHVLRLRKLTKELFDQKVRKHVVAGATLAFESDASVQQYYLNARFER